MRRISFSLTTEQVRRRTKDVTRRLGWGDLKKGTLLCAVEKARGLKKGAKPKRLAVIRVVSMRRERLDALFSDPVYGWAECEREGFPDLSNAEFVAMFCRSHRGCVPSTVVTRIEFAYE